MWVSRAKCSLSSSRNAFSVQTLPPVVGVLAGVANGNDDYPTLAYNEGHVVGESLEIDAPEPQRTLPLQERILGDV